MNSISVISFDNWKDIFFYLNRKELAAFSKTCKLFQSIINKLMNTYDANFLTSIKPHVNDLLGLTKNTHRILTFHNNSGKMCFKLTITKVNNCCVNTRSVFRESEVQLSSFHNHCKKFPEKLIYTSLSNSYQLFFNLNVSNNFHHNIISLIVAKDAISPEIILSS